MFVAQYSLPVKNYSNPTQAQRQSLLWSAEKPLKDSTTKRNPLSLKIMQMTQTFRNNTGKLKGKTLFQK